MECTEVPGCGRLIAALDQAVGRGDRDATAITRRVEAALCEVIGDGELTLPAPLRRPVAEGYARRLIHRDESLGYTAIAMVWGPGQATPLHDHSGLWCVEGVLEGSIEITQYDLLERDGVRCRFARQTPIRAGVGSAGRLIPPFDYHTIANPSARQAAITVHVYGGEMERCSAFHPRHDDWYERQSRELHYTAA